MDVSQAQQPSPVRFDVVALDTPDPAALAQFYGALLGWQVESEDDEWITIRGDGGSGAGSAPRMAFQRADDYVPPTWPDPAVPQQSHLDFVVDSLDEGEAYAISLGAVRVHGPDQTTFRVFRDPTGHLFCLCRAG